MLFTFKNDPTWQSSGMLYCLMKEDDKVIFSEEESQKIFSESLHKVKDTPLCTELFGEKIFTDLKVQHYAFLKILKDKSFKDLTELEIMREIISRKKKGESLTK